MQPPSPSPRRSLIVRGMGGVGIVLFALGCKPVSYAGEASSPGYGGEDEYRNDGIAMDSVAQAGAPAREEARWLESDGKQRDKDAYDSSKLSEPPAPPSPDSTEPTPTPTSESSEQPTTVRADRQIIYTAGIGMAVFDVADTMAKLEAIPERHGGWLEQRYDNSVVLRVPAAKLRSIITEISDWGVVEWKTLEALDVTAQYTDLDSRIRTLETVQSHLRELLDNAANVEQALEIQVELARVTAELESLRAQMRMLASSIAFSSLAVQLHERGHEAPAVGDDPFPWVDSLGAEATAYQ